MKAISACVLVFTKAPVAGQVKTRLQPVFSEAEALQLYLSLLNHTVKQHADADYAMQLVVSGDLEHPEIVRLSQRYDVPVVAQVGADLGARMQHAAAQALTQYEHVILVGCDCPALDQDTLVQAFALLHSHDVVIAPAEDGGYVLLGLRTCSPQLFDHIVWGSDQVLSATLTQAKKLGWTVALLKTFWDIDRPEDYPRYLAWLTSADPAD